MPITASILNLSISMPEGFKSAYSATGIHGSQLRLSVGLAIVDMCDWPLNVLLSAHIGEGIHLSANALRQIPCGYLKTG
jgi:hypothetical protein